MATALVKQLNDLDFEQNVSEGVTLVDFWAPWCAPCRAMGPVLEQLAESPDVSASIAKVNVDESPGLATRFGVQSIPLLVLLKDGQEVTRMVGLNSPQNIQEMINRAG